MKVPCAAAEPPAHRGSLAEGAGPSLSWEPAERRRRGGSRARGEKAWCRVEGPVSRVTASAPSFLVDRDGLLGTMLLHLGRRRWLDGPTEGGEGTVSRVEEDGVLQQLLARDVAPVARASPLPTDRAHRDLVPKLPAGASASLGSGTAAQSPSRRRGKRERKGKGRDANGWGSNGVEGTVEVVGGRGACQVGWTGSPDQTHELAGCISYRKYT